MFSTTPAGFAVPSTSSPRRSLAAATGLALLIFAGPVAAQAPSPGGGAIELRPYVGAFIPTGDQRDLLQDGVFAGLQASYRILPQLAITGTLGWSPSEDRITSGRPTLDVYQYDLGAEARASGWKRGETWEFTPFAGLGVGGRTYDYRDLGVGSTTNIAGYGALGGEFGFGRIGVRLEARDYVSGFKPLTGSGDSETRNDVTIAAGLTVRF